MAEHCTTDRASSDLLQHQSWPALILKRREPMFNASEFCKYRHRTLVYWRGDFYESSGDHYRLRSTDAVRAEVYSFLDCSQIQVQVSETEWRKKPFQPDTGSVHEVLSALKCLEGKTFVPEGIATRHAGYAVKGTNPTRRT